MGDRSESIAASIIGYAFFPAAIGFLAGCAFFYEHHWLVFIAGCVLGGAFYIQYRNAFRGQNRGVRIGSMCAILCFGFLLGYGTGAWFEARHPSASMPDAEEFSHELRIIAGSSRGPGKPTEYIVSTRTAKKRHRFIVRTDERLLIDTCAVISGTYKKPEAFATEYGRLFQYDTYLWARTIEGNIVLETHTPTACRPTVRGIAARGLFALSQAIEQKIRALFPPIVSGFVEGLLVGNKSALPDDVTEHVRRAGLSHIVVLSGFNIILIMTLATSIAAWFAGYRWRRIIALMFGWGIVLLSGAEAPALRAGVMASAILLGELFSRPKHGTRILVLTACILVFMNPRILLYDISFQLSFLATLGLSFVTPLIALKMSKWPRWIKDPLSETAGASVAVFPLIAYAMGALPLYGIVANILVVPFASYGTMAALAVLLLGFLIPVLGKMVAFPVALFLSVPLWIARGTAQLPFALITIPQFSASTLVLVYVVLISGMILWHHRHPPNG